LGTAANCRSFVGVFYFHAWLASRGGTATTFSIGEKSGLNSVRDPAGEKIAQGKDGVAAPIQ
jgi:hypothetical protein